MPLALLTIALLHASLELPPADALPAVDEMPDPFRFQDGRRVATLADWEERRAEMIGLIMGYQYGTPPPAPGNVQAEVIESSLRLNGTVKRTVLRLAMGPDHRIETNVYLYVPQGTGPRPVVVRFGIDTGVARVLNKRGYAYACFEHRAFDADTEGYDVLGPLLTLYDGCDAGAIAAWAWGASRVLDYLETVPDVDTAKSIVTGHSRTGKAALLAGVLDERFALAVPNGSGCSGAGAYRGAKKGVETLKLITFAQFADKEAHLPFDQHFMRALVAPRVVLSTDGLGDEWANPLGTQKAWMAAQPVFDFLGVPQHNLLHFREGGHDPAPKDYEVLMDVADWVFEDAPLTRDFSAVPEPKMKPDWTWKAPPAIR